MALGYIEVDNFYQELLCVSTVNIPEFLQDIIWINDDFMLDENIPFDFEAFELIDSKVNYLNPKHFSGITAGICFKSIDLEKSKHTNIYSSS